MFTRIAGELRGFLLALFVALVLGTTLALIIYWSPLPETLLDPLAKFTLLVSVFIGAWHSAMHFGNRGLLRGLTTGLAVFALVVLLTLIHDPSLLSLGPLLKNLLFLAAAGSLGGILGVGMSG